MQVNLIMQRDNENTLSNEIKKAFENKPKKAYFFCGTLKDTGFKLIEEEMIDSKAKIFFAIGIDKKNTTRSMLEDMLSYTKDVYYYSNNSVKEYGANIFIFEFTKKAIIYISSEKVSDASMTDDLVIYTKLEFNLEEDKEAKEYKEQIKNIVKPIEKELFTKLTKTKIEELIETKEIFSTRQYVHNVKSIAELLGNNSNSSENTENKTDNNDKIETAKSIEIPKVDLSDIDLDISDIDVSGVEESIVEIPKKEEKAKKEVKDNNIEMEDLSNLTDLADLSKLVDFNENSENNIVDENNELYDENLKDMEFDSNSTLDINDMLFSKADIALDYDAKEEENEEPVEEDIVKVKKVNLNNVTNFIYELPSKTTKGQDVSSLKIPNYIQTLIPEFFELVDSGKNIEIDGSNYKVREVKLEVVDVKKNEKYTDRKAKIMHKSGQSYLTFNADCIKDILFEESDIARIIKLASDVYHIEIIQKDMQEYKLWKKLCNQNFKSSARKYGMM